tara:strand:- start:4359 stop:6764 length:2406 start_codon:yes stop_codon:yes gene_type:complete
MNINNFLKPGNSINVIAAAGTGKTWFIIAKILRLLLEDINPEKITAITFTKKASAEMLDRLNKKVEGWSKQDEKSIKKDLEEIGINKNYEYYIAKAQKLFLKLQLNEKDIRISTLDAFFMEIIGQFYLDIDVPNNIKTNDYPTLVTKEVEKKIFNEKYFKEHKAFRENINFLNSQIGSFFSVKKSVVSIIEKKSYLLSLEKINSIDKVKINFEDDKKNLIKIILNGFDKNELLKKKYSNFLSNMSNINLSLDEKVFLIKDFFLTKSERLPRKKIINDFSKIEADIDSFLFHIYSYENNVFNSIQKAWLMVSKHFFSEYQKALKQNNLHDYSDCTWLCHKKLSELESDNWIFYKIANSINHLLIDEFQDTNSIQWEIIAMILLAVKELSDDSSVTIVGDSKQSIYGFRGSEPKLFDICRDFTKKNFNAKEVFLNESRRSSNEIVKFVNEKFETNNKFYTNIKLVGNVSVNTLNSGNESNIVIEAEKISSQIRELILEKNLNYSDITVLLKNRNYIDNLEEVFIKDSIPFSTDKKEPLLKNSAIKHLFYLLKYLILDEKNSFELYSILNCPIFNYSIKEISKINMNKFDELEELLLASKYAANIKTWRNILGKIPMHDLIDMIYNDVDIFNKYYSENSLKNKKIKNNFLNFLNISLSLNNGRYLSPFNFLYQVEKIKDDPGLYENLFDNSVRIMTIHSSKGLESEVVFLAQTYLSNNVKNQLRIIPIFNDDLTCKNLYLYLPKFFKNNRMIEKKFMAYKDKENLEELNLLYVACTRAKRILVINGFSDSKYSNSWFSNFLSCQ